MKPVSYQSLPSSVNGGHSSLQLNHVLGPSRVMYCEKCGFASTDATAFNKHVMEHMGMRFYCFYCNNISFSEAELNAHLKQHTSKYPFICPHCGQGYMRRLCLVKHIERLHSKSISQGPAKPGIARGLQVPVCSALTSASTADPAPLRPLVRVSVPPPSAPAIRLGRDDHRGKTLDTNSLNVTNGNAERFPFNGLIQHNRALTVSLPEEVSIPAGCLVELVEVKTVNGTKELKLRLVSQEENESVIKETQTTLPQNTALGKPLSSTLNHSNSVSSVNMGTCIVNRKQCEPKTVSVERPLVLPVSVSNNLPKPVSNEKYGLKRPLQDIIDLESNPVMLNKLPKKILCPGREGNSGSRLPPALVNHKAAPPTVMSSRVINRSNNVLHPDSMATNVPQRVADERKIIIPEHFSSIPPRRSTDTNSTRDVSVVVKVEPGGGHLKSNTVSKTITEAVSLAQQSVTSTSPAINRPIVSAAQIRPPAVLVNKGSIANESLLSRTSNKPISMRTPVFSNHTTSKMLSRPQEVRFIEMVREADVSEPESFPVISSVFSLSQQPEDVQDPIKPLVMALRGIVMDKANSSGSAIRNNDKIPNSTEQVKKAPISGCVAKVATVKGSATHDLPVTQRTSESVKVEDCTKGAQHPPALTQNHTCVKEEKSISLTEKDSIKSNPTTDSECPTVKEPCAKIPTSADAFTMPDPPKQMAKSEQDISSRFLTVSLKRVQVGVWKKCKKSLKTKISSCKNPVPARSVCAVIHPMPLRVDQLVTRPGPYQPVVVLNHPKPRICARGFRTDSFADSEGSEMAPECQILKMRLSKVMGQKYEVMGYTVRVFP